MSSRPAATWWVRAGSRAYGPFASERLPAFVREGRLTPETWVARDEAGPWLPAGRDPSLNELLQAPARSTSTPTSTGPLPDVAASSNPVKGVAGGRAFMVFVELLAGREEAFAAALARVGRTACARPGLWLLRADGDAAQLRNTLSQALGQGESLIVVEAAAQAAWFNLGGEADRALRGLWTAPPGA